MIPVISPSPINKRECCPAALSVLTSWGERRERKTDSIGMPVCHLKREDKKRNRRVV